MSLRSRLERKLRANLNEIQDIIQDFENHGGFKKNIFDPLADILGSIDEEERKNFPAPMPRGSKSIRDYYANLEVPFGADIETVKESYRQLMRKYHPDKHASDPESEKLATEISQELTRAYKAIESWLKTGRY